MGQIFKINDLVYVKSVYIQGYIEERIKDNYYKVATRNATIIVRVEDIEQVEVKISPSQKKKEPQLTLTEHLYEMDLHGFSRYDAIKEVKIIIESANRHKYSEIRITHGKGQGILRQAIHELLKSYKQSQRVKAYEYAPDYRGGYGVTIVFL